MKRKNRRNKVKYPSLKKEYNLLIRHEYMDLDYLNKLDDTKKTVKLPNGKMVTELEFMSIFMNEWNNGGVGKQKEAKKNKLHRTAKAVKKCTDQNNARNRDIYGRAKIRNLISYTHNGINDTSQSELHINTNNTTEDCLIAALDEMVKLRNSSEDT
jgi:hypothetical protein